MVAFACRIRLVRPSYTWPCDAGWSSQVARRAHNPEVAGSNPAPATAKGAGNGAFSFAAIGRLARRKLPNLEYDLAARVSTRDTLQGFAHLLEWQYRLDLGVQLPLVDQPAD